MISEQKPNLLLTKLQELAELNLLLSKRKYLNPLEFYEHLPIPKAFHDCDLKIKGLLGGNRSGKTQEGAEYVIEKCLESKIRVWACAESFSDSVNIQQRKIWELIPKNQVRYCYYDEVNGFRNRKVIFNNGSITIFKSYDQKREAFQGDDVDIIWNDEEPPYEIYREQRMRLIDRDGEMVFTLTALKGMTDLISELFDDHELVKSQYSPLVNDTLPRIIRKNGAMFFMLWTTENPYISQARLAEDIKVMTRQEIKSRVCGIPTNLSGRLYPNFNRQVHVVSKEDLPTRLVTLYCILDPHDRKPWAISWWAVDKTDTAYCVREYPWKKNFNEMDSDDKSYEEYGRIIRDVESELFDIYGRSVEVRVIDPNFGNKTVQLAKRNEKGNAKTTPIKELAKMGFKFIDGMDDLESGHLQVRKGLAYTQKDGVVIQQPRLLFNEECENTIRHMIKYSHKDIEGADGDDKAKPQLTQKFKDFCDLVRYGAMKGFKYIRHEHTTPVPEPRRY